MKKIPLTFILLLWCVLGYAQGSCVPTSSTINPTACGTYFAPSGQAFTSSGSYQDTITNVGGCDSLITINLTIEQFSTGAATLAVDNAITCVGGNDGAISATIKNDGALLISEANLGNTDYIEITNVSNDSIDVTGYYVAASNSYTNINSVNTITWDLTGKIAGGDSDFREDASGSANYWGSNLFYNPGSAGWILLFDNNDNVIDAVFFEWSSADIINNFAPTIKGQVVTLGAQWIGNGISGSGCTNSISRSTVNDSNTDIDWTCLPSNPGSNNISGTFTPTIILNNTWNTGDTSLAISNLVTGTYVLSSVDTLGCTYLDSLFLPDATPDTSTINIFTCGNYTSPAGNVYTMSGVYMDTIVSAAGCDSIITINLNTGATPPVNLTATVCDTFRSPSGALYTMSGMYNDTIPSVGGCDSILIIDLTVNYSSYSLISPTACGTYMAPSGRSYTASGTYLDTIPNVIGCDSIITINLTIEQFSTGGATLTVDNSISCPGGNDGAISAVINVPNPLLISEVNLTAPDYIEITNAAANPIDVTGYYVATSNSYTNINTVNARTWDLTGIMAGGAVDYREDATGTNYWGNNLLYNPGSTGWVLLFDNNDNVVDAVFWGWTSADIANFAPTVKGNVVSLGAEWLGDGVDDNCNDALIRSLSTDNNNLTDWACLLDSKGGNNITGTITADNINSTTWNTGDTSLSISNLMAGTYILTSVDSTLGCTYLDSITLMDGMIITTTVSATACDSYTSPAGMVYTMSGTYTDTVTSSAGCDSIIITNLTINNSTTSSISPSACASYTSPSGMVYTMSGTYTDTLTNAIGCDSIITINLTISSPTTATINPSACASYTSPSGMVYTMSGTYTDTLTNAIGCDSIITINLSINNSMATISPNSCGDYTSPSGMLYTMSGTYVDTIANVAGCDSIITINLTVTNIDTTVTLTGNVLSANATGASYQWIDCANNSPVAGATGATFTPPANGDYAVVLTQNGCTDTSSCINVTVIGVATLSDDNSIQLYPNPTSAVVTIQLDLAYEQALVQVYNAAGQRVLQQTFDQQPQVTLDLQEQPAGSYWVSILINDQQKTFLVVKE